MYTDFYERIAAPWRHYKGGAALLGKLDNGLRIGIASAYCILLIALATTNDVRLLRAVMVPALCFALVSILRIMINEDRPYEAYPIHPLIYKDTHGCSMPSRHMASATVIACTICWINVLWGIVAFVACTSVAYVRIVGGVHFPRDIAVGAAIAVLFALLGFVLIP